MLIVANKSADTATTWWWAAMTDATMLRCAAIGLVAAAAVVVLATLLWKLHRGRRDEGDPANGGGRLADASGTATLEFCLVFPILLFFALLLAQTTTLMAGNMVVHYAAFAATRTAIVQIPADYTFDGEPANVLVHREGNRKYNAIRQAAVVALWPVAGRGSGGNVPADRVADGVGDYFAAYGVDQPAWVHALLPDRLRYAADQQNTVVTVYRYDGVALPGVPLVEGEIAQFGPKDPVSVSVQHRLNLAVPYVRAIFADGREDGSAYALVNARSTLTNEGIVDQLPPLPSLERRP